MHAGPPPPPPRDRREANKIQAAARCTRISLIDHRDCQGTAHSSTPLARTARAVMSAPSLYDLGEVADIDGHALRLDSLKGKVVLAINVACE